MNESVERAKERIVAESPVHGPILLAEIARLEARAAGPCPIHRDAECDACWDGPK